jgi:alkyl hydroperoxide reductase subunit D
MEFEQLFNNNESTIARDLKLNLKRLLEEGALSRDEALLTLLATASSVNDRSLTAFARQELAKLSIAEEQIKEAAETAAIMAMLNMYYRFKHMVGKPDDYKAAGLRMTSLSKPVLGKEKFEMLALAVSVLNGCENCIKAHEQVLRDSEISVDKIHDLARIAAVVKAVGTLSQIMHTP